MCNVTKTSASSEDWTLSEKLAISSFVVASTLVGLYFLRVFLEFLDLKANRDRPINAFIAIELVTNAGLGCITNVATIAILLSPVPIGTLVGGYPLFCFSLSVIAVFRL